MINWHDIGNGGVNVGISYNKLWKLLIDKKMNKTELKETSGISFNVLARMGKNEPISFEESTKRLSILLSSGTQFPSSF